MDKKCIISHFTLQLNSFHFPVPVEKLFRLKKWSSREKTMFRFTSAWQERKLIGSSSLSNEHLRTSTNYQYSGCNWKDCFAFNENNRRTLLINSMILFMNRISKYVLHVKKHLSFSGVVFFIENNYSKAILSALWVAHCSSLTSEQD